MRYKIFILLLSIPTSAVSQFDLELGYSEFRSNSGFNNSEKTTYPGVFGNINYTDGYVTLSACVDYNFNDNQNSGLSNETAIIAYRVGLKVNLEIIEFIYFRPGIKVGTYKIGYESITFDEISRGQLGYAIGCDLAIDVFGGFAINLCIENNALFKGKWSDGNPDPGFEGTYVRPGIILYL